jgi:hypothetical protein
MRCLTTVAVEENCAAFQCPCNCKAIFCESDLFHLMRQCRNLKQRKLRELVQGMLLSCTRLASMEGEDRAARKRKHYHINDGPEVDGTNGNLHTFYHIFNEEVCKVFFMFITGAGLQMLKNIHADQRAQQIVTGD